MRSLRKFVSLAVMTSIAVVPLIGLGCADQSGGAAAPSQAVTTGDAKPADQKPADKKSADKKKKKKKAPRTTSESSSTTGGGVTPPVK